MNSIARRLLVAAVHKLLPEAVPDNPYAALALRSDAQLAVSDQRNSGFPTRSQTLDAPPSMPVQPVTAPAPSPRRRRKVVIETVTYEETEW